MYLHLGQNTVIKEEEIIGIFDMDNTTVSKISREYLSLKQKNEEIVNVSLELPKAFVVCSDKNKKENVYITQISTSTLLKRTRSINL